MFDNILKKLIRKLVTLHYKRTHFLAYCFGIDDLNGISILSEEVCDGYTRFGTKEIPHRLNSNNEDEQESAHWIEHEIEDTCRYWECSKCNKESPYPYDFCPNCGIHMIGVPTKSRFNCQYRHENGNCLRIGGFCTSVDNKYCPKINN